MNIDFIQILAIKNRRIRCVDPPRRRGSFFNFYGSNNTGPTLWRSLLFLQVLLDMGRVPKHEEILYFRKTKCFLFAFAWTFPLEFYSIFYLLFTGNIKTILVYISLVFLSAHQHWFFVGGVDHIAVWRRKNVFSLEDFSLEDIFVRLALMEIWSKFPVSRRRCFEGDIKTSLSSDWKPFPSSIVFFAHLNTLLCDVDSTAFHKNYISN